MPARPSARNTKWRRCGNPLKHAVDAQPRAGRWHRPGPCAGRQLSLFQDNVRFAFGGCSGPGAAPFVLLSALARGPKKSGARFFLAQSRPPRCHPERRSRGPRRAPLERADARGQKSRARWGGEREARFWRPGRFCGGFAFDFGLRFCATGVALMELRFRRVPRPGCRSSQHPQRSQSYGTACNTKGSLLQPPFRKVPADQIIRPQNMNPASTTPRVCLVFKPVGPNTNPGVTLRASTTERSPRRKKPLFW
jgi:hypothetical protein